MDDLEKRLTRLEARYDEKWQSHEKASDMSFDDVKMGIKNLAMQLQVVQDKCINQPHYCIKEFDCKLENLKTYIDKQVEKTDATVKEQIRDSERKVWTILSFVTLGIPTIMIAIYAVAAYLTQ